MGLKLIILPFQQYYTTYYKLIRTYYKINNFPNSFYVLLFEIVSV